MKKKEEQTRENASHAWQALETNLNFILQHLKDAREVGNIEERAMEIHRHALKAKEMYDFIDSNCTVEFY